MNANKTLIRTLDLIADILLWIKEDSYLAFAFDTSFGDIFLPVFNTHQYFNMLGLFTIWPIITVVVFIVTLAIFIVLLVFGIAGWSIVGCVMLVYFLGKFLFFSKSKERK